MKKRVTRHLDFGSGLNLRNPFKREEVYSLDIFGKESQYHKNIGPDQEIPFEDNYFDSVSAYDVLEHLSRVGNPSPFIFYMNEMFRVLKNGGEAIFVFPLSHKSDFFDDPTHVNPLNLNTFLFFAGDASSLQYAGIQTSYKVVKLAKLRDWEKYVDSAEVANHATVKNESLRRKLSLAKRSLTRWASPTHGIFIGRK